jgi:hypothetical protein
MLRLRVRVTTQGNRRIDVCLVTTVRLPRGPEAEPSGLTLETWEQANQVFTGFRVPLQTLDYFTMRPIVSSALLYLTRYAAAIV